MTESPSTPTPRTQAHERPLSPHLSIYRMPLTAGVASITHRITGVFLALGVVFFVAMLWIAAYCTESYDMVIAYSQNWWGRIPLMLWSLAFFYHFINGVRHLGWDAGHGLDLQTATNTGHLSIYGSLIITAFVWYLLLA